MLLLSSYILYLVMSVVLTTRRNSQQFDFTNDELQKFTMDENQPPKTFVGKVKFSKNFDDDLTFTFTEKSSFFAIDSKTGDLTTVVVLDLESLCPGQCPDKDSASIPLTVSIQKESALISMVKVIITVLDVDDNVPEFEENNILIEVKEMIYRKNRIISLPAATDRDILQKHREVNYRISGDCAAFILEENKFKAPKLRLLEDMDYETKTDYRLTLFAYHKFDDKVVANLSVHIKVININDCAPQFPLSQYDVTIDEDVAVEEKIIQVNASDPDGDKLKYTMLLQNDHFQIRENGEVFVIRQLDFEKQQSYSFTIQALDGEFMAETNLHIVVNDVNDEAPMYTLNPKKLVIDETNKIGILVGQITIYDRDSPSVNRGLRCTEPNYNDQALRFHSDGSSNDNILIYKLYTINVIDREMIPSGVLYSHLMCYDSGTNRQLHQNISIPLYVNDVNDNSPHFGSSQYQVGVRENNEIGFKFYQVSAKDEDTGINGELSYSIRPSMDSDVFQIESSSGWIKVVQSLDRETKAMYKLTIIAYDQSLVGRRSGSTTLVIKILDDNDNAPILVDAFELSIKENQPLGSMVGTLKAFDKDEGDNARVTFQLSFNGGSQPFELHENGTLISNQVFDREKQSKFCTQIQLSDSSSTNRLTSQNAICVTILDENDNYPQIFLYENDKTGEIKPSTQNRSLDGQSSIDYILQMSIREQAGFVLAVVKARDEDANNNSQLAFYLENIDSERDTPSAFDINIRSGSIFLNRPLHRDFIGTQKWKVIVEDSGTPALKSAKNIIIKILDISPHQTRTETSRVTDNSQSPWIGNNFLIAITLSIISALLILLLISAIVCIVKPCQNRDRFRNPPYNSDFVPSLMFQDQMRNTQTDLTEKSKFEISEHMDGLWGGTTLKPYDPRMMCELNCKNPLASSTTNEYFQEIGPKNLHIDDYNTNAYNYPMYNAPTSLRLLLRNDEQRSDSGKGASDDDMSYVPKFVNESLNVENNDVAASMAYTPINNIQMVHFPAYLFNGNSQNTLPQKNSSKTDCPNPTILTYSSTNI